MTDEERLEAKAIGDLGELELERLARQVGMATNRVKCDEHGWDYLVELPRSHLQRGALSLDLAPCESHCFVQVKTITSPDGRARIALSNWNRMIKGLEPWFVMIVVLNADREPSEAYLVHVDKEWCSRVLERLRDLPESEAQALHKHWLDVSWKDHQRLSKLHGRVLDQEMRFHLGADLPSYMALKRSWVEEAGYQANRHRLTITVAASEADDASRMKAELAVGLRDRLPVKALKAEEIRFGIAKTMLEENDVETYVELPNRQPDARTTITLEKRDHSEVLELLCDTYAAVAIFPDLPEKYRFVRCVARFVSVTWSHERSEALPEGQMMLTSTWVVAGPPESQLCNIEELGVAARAAMLLHSSAITPLSFTVQNVDGVGFSRTDLGGGGGIDPHCLYFWKAIDSAHRLATHFRLSREMEVDATLLATRANDLGFLASCLAQPGKPARFSGDGVLPGPIVAESAALIVAPFVQIGAYVVGLCVAIVGRPEFIPLGSNRYRIEVGDGSVRTMKEFCIPTARWTEADLADVMEVARRTLDGEGIALVIVPEDEPQELSQG